MFVFRPRPLLSDRERAGAGDNLPAEGILTSVSSSSRRVASSRSKRIRSFTEKEEEEEESRGGSTHPTAHSHT